MSLKLAVLGIALLVASAATCKASEPVEGEVVESGAFRLHLYKRPTGRETYEIRRDGDGLVLKATYENKDRGVTEPLTATLAWRRPRRRPRLSSISM